MSLTKNEVEKIAHLARLGIKPDEIDEYANGLTNIIQFVEKIKAVATKEVPPMANPLVNMTQRLRADKVTESNEREAFLNLAPQTEAGLYLVPKVLNSEE